MENNTKKYRDNGAIGALLDEYERSILELIKLLDTISQSEFEEIVDTETNDDDCRSIQTILRHVVQAGYGYSVYVRNQQGENLEKYIAPMLDSPQKFQQAILEMFAYNEAMFETYDSLKIEEYNPDKKMLTSWGQIYDVEQIYEHAIVHILRHRRQIERFLLKLRGKQ